MILELAALSALAGLGILTGAKLAKSKGGDALSGTVSDDATTGPELAQGGGSILNVRGIAKLSPAARQALLDAAAQLGIPVDSMALVIASESGFDPTALNPLPAAGLIQLTRQAGLPGFLTEDAIRAITSMSAEDQIALVVAPFYARFGSKAQGASPSTLYMLNFLPAVYDMPDDTVLAVRSGNAGPGNESPEDLLPKSKSKLGTIYAQNPGFDLDKKGYYTIGDVKAKIDRDAAAAGGKRITVDGTIIDPGKTAAGPGVPARRPFGDSGGVMAESWPDEVVVAFDDGAHLCTVSSDGSLEDQGGIELGPGVGLTGGRVYATRDGVPVDLGPIGADDSGNLYMPWGAEKRAQGCSRCFKPTMVLDANSHPAWFDQPMTAGGMDYRPTPMGNGMFGPPFASERQPRDFGNPPMPPPPMMVQIAQPIIDEPMVFDAFNSSPYPFVEQFAVQPSPYAEPPASDPFTGTVEVHVLGTRRAQGPGDFPVGETQPPRPFAPRRRAMGIDPTKVDIIKREIVPAVQDGSYDAPTWTQIPVNEYQIMVTNEPLTVGGIRLPTSVKDQYDIAFLLGALPITKTISDARWAQAKQVTAQPIADSRGALLNDPEQVLAYNDRIGPNTGEFRDGFWKETVLVPNLRQSGRGAMAQYGFRKPGGGVYQQGQPGDHDENWKDYSNTPTYVSRKALKNGVEVDLLDELAAGSSLGGPLPQWLVDRLRGGEAGV